MTERGPSGQGPRGTTPGRPSRGQRAGQRSCVRKMKRGLGRAPRGTTTQMAMRGNRRGSRCRGAGQGMGTTTAEIF